MKTLRLLAALAFGLWPVAVWGQASPSPYTNAARYDAAGRVTGTIAADPDGAGPHRHLAVRNSYDGAGRLIRVENGELATWQSEAIAPANWTGFTIFRTLETDYDARGRKTREALREGATGPVRTLTQSSYDSLGRLDCTATRMNPALFASPPASACTPGPPGSDGPDRITRNVYDAAGQRLQLREGVGTGEEAAEATWAYNTNGQIVTMIDGNGNRAALRYDGYGRQDRWTFPSPARAAAFNDATQATALASAGSVNAGDYEEYGYDAAGNRTSLRKRDGSTLTYQYDNLNRLIVKLVPERAGLTAAQTRDVFYGYDLRNLQLYARFDSAAGPGISHAYDGFGRLTSTTATMDGASRTLAYQYDANGNRTRITHPDGNRFEMDYDGIGRPITLWMNESTAVAGLWYYAHGAPSARSPSNGAYSEWGYDAVQRLNWIFQNAAGTAADLGTTLGYNPASQIGSRTLSNDSYAWTGHYAVNRNYTTNGLNQYTAAGSAGFAYDLNGNLTSDGATNFTYDIENRLVGASGARNATLAYDPLGRLYQITAADGAITRFLYDGDDLVAEYDGAGALLRRYVHWAVTDAPFLWYEGATLDSARYLNADQQGSIILVSDQLGTPSINRYDEYGIPQSTNLGRFQYTGQIWLAEIGMYYYKNRIYSATLGRFMQTDAVGYQGGVNLYAYVGDDPVNSVDPDGQYALPLLGLCIGPQAAVCTAVVAGTTAVAGCAAYEPCRGFLGRVAQAMFPIPLLTPGFSPSLSPEPSNRPLPAPGPVPSGTTRPNRLTVFRLHGGTSGPDGPSWTTVDPRTMTNPRNSLGLPNGNTAEHLDIGTLTSRQGVSFRAALPGGENRYGPNTGGAPEVLIPNAATQVRSRTTQDFHDPAPPRRRDEF